MKFLMQYICKDIKLDLIKYLKLQSAYSLDLKNLQEIGWIL